MFDRIRTSFELARSSWNVLREDKKLVIFPILSGIATMLVFISFAVPLAVVAANTDAFKGMDQGEGSLPPWIYLVAFAYYFCSYFVIVFCNSALVSFALMKFGGEQPTIGDGLRAASSRMPQILAWAFVSATVGIILKAIENAHEKAGQIISAILGTGWTIMTFFVVPILVVEKVGPFEAVRRSVALLKKSWGEALAGHVGLGLFSFLLALPAVALLFLGGFLMTVNAAAGLTVLALALFAFLAAMAMSAALNTIFLSALYQYAAYQTVPAGFDETTMRNAFAAKA